MKKRLFLCLSLAFIVCLGLYIKTHASFIYVPAELWQQDHSKMDSQGLDASKPRILSTPADGSVFHGERNVTPGYGQVVSEVWTPTKPEDYYYVKIGITAIGYGEVAFTLNGSTSDYTIGHWTSEPLKKADSEPFTHEKRYLTNIINESRVGFADEISPATVRIIATGKAQTRSRLLTTYSSRQAALSAQASTTGPGIGFVIGRSTFWKFEPGITRDPNADDYDGSYKVTINDTNVDPGSSSGSGSTGSLGGNPGSSPTMLACGVHSSGTSGDHSLQASCSTDSSCISTNFYLCSHSHSYPSTPTDNTPDCSYCTDGCSSCQSSSDDTGSSDSSVACGNSCGGSVGSRFEHRTECSGSRHSNLGERLYWTCDSSENDRHRDKTCFYCGTTFKECEMDYTCLGLGRAHRE